MTRLTIDFPLDSDPPDLGVVLAYPRVSYRVDSIREVESALWPNRWAIQATGLGPHGGVPPIGSWPCVRYGPGEGPRDFMLQADS